jgi:hypothetical protein
LQKGVGAGELLSGWQEERKSREVINGSAGVATGSGGGGSYAGKGSNGASMADGGETSSTRARKGESTRISLELFREGFAIEEIAARRGFSLSTIEGHLASFIGTGEVDIKELVQEHKIGPILDAIKAAGGIALGPIRGRLGDGYSFGEIKAVLQHLQRPASAGSAAGPAAGRHSPTPSGGS